MILQNQNQNNLNLDSNKLKDVINMVQQSGMTPEEYVKNLVNTGKVSNQQLEEAINFAKSKIGKV